ncbi:M67 family metallopeptidase [Sandaracinobacter sp. RS1-74]|uniref:M67 family metallopeptidase n=1 Tax=Sandaracinobacteroides sayramensis TaxID=2913411 RepID=UPI001EDA9EFA|nr:M67 family metallopeptidase [Sandaracinobacteroides sayramensis]MCG2841733.1 M67 family metallopeptidase [Sandaracinobacteroides sayramensis]
MDVGTIAAGSTPVRLESAAACAMLAAAAAAAPDEACGLLFGEAAHIREASIAANRSPTPASRFEIDPAHLFDAQRRHRAGPERLVGCWHSHPNGNGCPSRQDREGVADMGWLWLIVADGRIHAWRPTPAGFEAVAIAGGSL